MKLGKNEDQSVDTLPLLGIGSNAPMEGATETEFGAETKGWTIQRLYHPRIHPIINHQTQTLLYIRMLWTEWSMCPYYQLEHLLDICPWEVLLDIPLVLCPIFWGTARLISRVVVPVCNPTSNGGVFLFLHIFASICCHLIFLILAILTGVRWNLGCLGLHFPDD